MSTFYVHPCQNLYFCPIPKVEYRPIQLTKD
ncbi:hypothetical protein RDI58_025934 [Solanum bulbocastanum]|uniref:Uncharacterized protein n=1 Tax=Solanum bulbocastanum TaxID=147425 RepID=A0AAN8SSX7_SOLBU